MTSSASTSVFTNSTPDGGVFRIVGVDHLSKAVRLIDGRLPKPCSGGVCGGILWERDKAPRNVVLDPTVKL